MSRPAESGLTVDTADHSSNNTPSHPSHPSHRLSPASPPLQGREPSREPSRDLAHDSSATAESGHEPRRLVAPKRRRTSKACDDCRRKKIKCDGRQPCSSSCSYSKLPNRRGSSKPKHVNTLETRLRVAESLLRKFLPHVDLDNIKATTPPSQSSQTEPRIAIPDGTEDPAASQAGITTTAAAATTSEPAGDGARFIPIAESAGQLDLTDTGEYDFHGVSSGAAFLRRITQHFPGLFRYDSRMPFLPPPHGTFHAKPLELPVYSANPWWLASYDFSKLPPRQLALDLCKYSFSRASCILRVVHAPSFWKTLEKLYDDPPQAYTPEERRFVGLLFSVMALGSMYDVDENDPTNPDHYAVAMERGSIYYISARHYLQDITECCDMTTLQALVFIIQFLQATGNLNGCHTFVGIALRSALRMGLHRHLPHASIAPIKDETRKRVFHTIRQTDIYLSTTLGLPLLLHDRDIDQPWPTEVDDEYITENGIQQPPPGTPSFLAAFNAHARLMRILAKVVEYLYPPTGTDRGSADVTYMISFAKIREMERDLHRWHEQLPRTWRPGPEQDLQITRAKILLRFAYAHVQLMLYRPFLQYYSRQVSVAETADERYFALATAGINVCRNIIQIGLEIRKQAVLIGPYWFTTYTQFFAVLSLLLYVVNNPNHPRASELFADARLGKDCISGLTQRSLAADRVSIVLNSLFDNLPEKLKSTNPETQACNSGSNPTTGDSRPRYQTRNTPQQSSLSRFAGAQQWQLNPAPDSGTHMSRPFQYHATNIMDFPLEDPFAYPLLPGVSLIDNSFTSLHEDALRLPLHSTHMDMEEQLFNLQDLSPLPFMSTPE
ncbi:fungal-specific transcription factor domain-containing protein [Hypoxylon sp. FL1150]|nr:fungal-specific transcription factor domain-containing protein [Hypoxylon sp. FL1150]